MTQSIEKFAETLHYHSIASIKKKAFSCQMYHGGTRGTAGSLLSAMDKATEDEKNKIIKAGYSVISFDPKG